MSARSRRPLTGGTGPVLRQLPRDPDTVVPATRRETLPIGLMAVVVGFLALAVSATRGFMLLYGDAVAHLGIARRIVDNNTPGLVQWGGVWLPLPHLLMLPFIRRMEWWQDGMAGAWPSLICYVLAVMGLYRLARRMVPPRWALVATAFFGLNANLLYLSSTAMTEPLFLALLIWIVLLACELLAALRGGLALVATQRLILLGVLILAAVMTRYDGWILGAVVWCVVAWQMGNLPTMRGRVMPGFAVFTLLVVAGPLMWFGYNHVYAHDWLDFMRGPYSAREIDRRTSPPGSHHYFGWHDPAWSLMLYARTAQVDAAAWETGWLVAAAALWATWKAWKNRVENSTVLLWFPLPFYVYSISYGSVPIFIPQLYPHSFYNSRYGMELLPAFSIFLGFAVFEASCLLKQKQPLLVRFMQPMALLLIVLNLIAMMHAVPLVLKEAMVNSRLRLALEEPLAQQMNGFAPGAPIMIDNSEYVGALQRAGIPLKQTVGPADYYAWRAGSADPSHHVGYLVSAEGDAVSKVVKEHPEGLTELSIVCTSGRPCLRVYRSDRYGGDAR